MIWQDLAFVALGAIAGALVRFGASTAWPTVRFPFATLAVNLVGALIIGFAMLPEPAGHTTRLWLVVGFLGALTTLSTYSYETIDLLRSGRTSLAIVNVLLNGLGGPLLAVAGWRLRVAMP